MLSHTLFELNESLSSFVIIIVVVAVGAAIDSISMYACGDGCGMHAYCLHVFVCTLTLETNKTKTWSDSKA